MQKHKNFIVTLSITLAAFILSSNITLAAKIEYFTKNDMVIGWNTESDDGKTCWLYPYNTVEAFPCPEYKGDFVIPEELIGRKIVGIAANTFANCTRLTGIVIGGNVEEIKAGAFTGCTNLRTLVFAGGDSTLYIRQNAMFGDCSLDSVYIDRNLKLNQYTLFGYNSSVGTITFGPSAKTIPANFLYANTYGHIKVNRFIIPATVETVLGEYQFNDADINEFIIDSSDIPLNTSGWLLSLGNAKSVDIDRPVTHAFRKHKEIRNLRLGPNVIRIDDHLNYSAFEGCKRLKVADLACTIIGKEAFSGCDSLETLILRDGIQQIHSSAFVSCHALKELTLPGSWDYRGYAEDGYYADNLFNNCKKLRRVNNLNLHEIPTSMFMGCDSLREFEIGYAVKTIKNYAFKGTAVKKITVPANVENIHIGAFLDCDSLEELRFEDGEIPLTIGIGGLSWRNPIKKLYIGRTIPYRSGDYRNVYDSPFADTRMGEVLEFGPKVTKIPYSFARHATLLKDLTIGSGVDTIEARAFRDCSALEYVVIPANVRKIYQEAFSSCSSLAKVTIETNEIMAGRSGDIPMTIDEGAFVNSSNIREVEVIGAEIPELHKKAFHSDVYGYAMLVVPYGMREKFRSHPAWSQFKSISEQSTTGIVDEPSLHFRIKVNDGCLSILADENRSISVFDLMGKCIYSGIAPVELMLKSGLYIVRCADEVIKVAVK